MDEKIRTLYKKAIEVWTPQKQIGMLHEEMGELMVAINRLDRGRGTPQQVLTELVDVEILLGQMRVLFALDDSEHEIEYNHKIARLEQRLVNTKREVFRCVECFEKGYCNKHPKEKRDNHEN